MSNSESQNQKGRGGRKPKFDYTSEDFLSLVESYAKKRDSLIRKLLMPLGYVLKLFVRRKVSTPN